MSGDGRVFVLGAVRTPVGDFGGALAGLGADELGAIVIREAVARAGLGPAAVGHVIMGLVLPGAGINAARLSALRAGLADTTCGLTVDRACCSSLSAVGLAVDMIRQGVANCVVAGGMENMSQTPYLVPQLRWGRRLGDIELRDPLLIRNPLLGEFTARYSAEGALREGIGRVEQDRWAVRSHERAAAARDSGAFDPETVAIDTGSRLVRRDERPRSDVAYEAMASLPTVYGSATVTAGNASGLSDGAAAVVLAAEATVAGLGLRPQAEILAFVSVAGEPQETPALQARAMQDATRSAGLELDTVDVLELHEGFALYPLIGIRRLADGAAFRADRLRDTVNMRGGAVALGHPLGASGCRSLVTLVHILAGGDGRIGAVSVGGLGGQADALVIRATA